MTKEQLESKLKEFCGKTYNRCIEDLMEVLPPVLDYTLYETKNSEIMRSKLVDFQKSSDLLAKQSYIMFGDISFDRVKVKSDFAMVLLQAKQKSFNKIKDYNMIIVYRKE